jgi:nucleotide-binding universal stress UspA family protein
MTRNTESAAARGADPPSRTPRVIIAFNGSPAGDDALRLGELLGRWTNAELVVACVYPPESLGGVPFDPRASRIAAGDHRIFVRQDAEAVLAEAGEALPDDLDVTFSAVECESPLGGLRQLALSGAPDLLVLGSSHRGPVKQLFHRSMSRRALRHLPCALAVAPLDFRNKRRRHERLRRRDRGEPSPARQAA